MLAEYIMVVILCFALQEAWTELPPNETGPVQRSLRDQGENR